MLKIASPICRGADIHKNSTIVTIITTDQCGISQYEQENFSTINSAILRFYDWLIEHHCYHVCMESQVNTEETLKNYAHMNGY